MTVPALIIMILILGLISFLLIRGMVREFQKAVKKDKEEKTEKHLKRVFLEYSIVVVVCAFAFVFVHHFQNTEFISNISHKLYGHSEPIQTIAPTLPFSR